MDLAKLEEQLERLEQKYQQWVAPMNRAIQEKARKINRDGYSGGDFFSDVRRIDAEQRAKYDPYQEMYALLDQLCPQYLTATAPERSAIRSAVSNRRGVLSALLGYVDRAARQIRSSADTAWLLHGLAAASIENCRRDYRDVLLALAELYVAAEAGGIDPRPEFIRVAALSDGEKPTGGPTPVSEMLAQFHEYAVLRERKARPT